MSQLLRVSLLTWWFTASVFASEAVNQNIQVLRAQGITVQQFYEEKLDQKVTKNIKLLKQHFSACKDIWPTVTATMQEKIKRIQIAQTQPYTAPLLTTSIGYHKTALKQFIKSDIHPNTVQVQFVPQASFAQNYYSEEHNAYIVSFDRYSAGQLAKPHFRAAINHEISHIEKNDEITKKFLFNMLVCAGENPNTIKYSPAWIKLNHALETRADILPLFKSEKHAQDMLSLMGTHYEHSKEEGTQHLMSPTHPSLEKRYKTIKTVVTYIQAEKELPITLTSDNALEA